MRRLLCGHFTTLGETLYRRKETDVKKWHSNREVVRDIFKAALFLVLHLCPDNLGADYQLLPGRLSNLELVNENWCRPDNELLVFWLNIVS